LQQKVKIFEDDGKIQKIERAVFLAGKQNK
jgi:hypothetical protein